MKTSQKGIDYKIIRHNRDINYTLGTLISTTSNFEVETLELPWKDNQKEISCIPNGIYEVTARYTKTFKKHWHIRRVKNRTWILIHIANYTRQIKGCIAPGLTHADINGDGVIDVTNSRKAMNKLRDELPDRFTIEIV